MRRIKKGFSLAEVATAMAVVGIVASIIIPQTAKTLQKQQSGIMLGRAIAQIEVGNQNLIQLANQNESTGSIVLTLEMINERELIPNNPTNNPIIRNLGAVVPSFWGLDFNNIEAEDVRPVRTFDGDPANDFITMIEHENTSRFNFAKIPASIAIVSLRQPNQELSEDVNVDTSILIYVDTNGWDRMPNTFGKDIFLFSLMNGGKLRPYNQAESGGLDLTEQVVEDGFRINYY